VYLWLKEWKEEDDRTAEGGDNKQGRQAVSGNYDKPRTTLRIRVGDLGPLKPAFRRLIAEIRSAVRQIGETGPNVDGIFSCS
jgi:hypothetical protein